MAYQKLFKSTYIEHLSRRLKEGNFYDDYLHETFSYDENEVLENPNIFTDYPSLIMPETSNNHDFDNAKIIFDAYRSISPTQATDIRIWTYLSHVTYWEYMRERRRIEDQPEEKRGEYILQHWFIESLNSANLLRHDISLLWWTSYLTYIPEESNPYILTEEAFSMLDYTRHLLPGTQGRNRYLIHGMLEFVIENRDLFSKYKESKVRFLMRKTNFLGGYKMLTDLSKNDIKNELNRYKSEVASIESDN